MLSKTREKQSENEKSPSNKQRQTKPSATLGGKLVFKLNFQTATWAVFLLQIYDSIVIMMKIWYSTNSKGERMTSLPNNPKPLSEKNSRTTSQKFRQVSVKKR